MTRVLALAAAAALAAGAMPLPGANVGEARADAGSFWQFLRPASQYKRGAELDVRPAPLGEVNPAPPPGSEAHGGRVVARILINESGAADRVLIEASEPSGMFDDSVRDAFRAARYRPGMKAGAAVKSQMRVEVRFDPLPQRRPLRP